MQMTYEDYSNLATEMNILFKYMDEDLVEKIPRKIIEFFQDIASPTFRSRIDPRFPLDEQYLLPSTECMLTLLYRQYWCSPEEREELDQLLISNAKANQEAFNNMFNDNIFDKIENSENLFIEEDSNLPTTISNNTILNKLKEILQTISNLFKKLFNM